MKRLLLCDTACSMQTTRTTASLYVAEYFIRHTLVKYSPKQTTPWSASQCGKRTTANLIGQKHILGGANKIQHKTFPRSMMTIWKCETPHDSSLMCNLQPDSYSVGPKRPQRKHIQLCTMKKRSSSSKNTLREKNKKIELLKQDNETKKISINALKNELIFMEDIFETMARQNPAFAQDPEVRRVWKSATSQNIQKG